MYIVYLHTYINMRQPKYQNPTKMYDSFNEENTIIIKKNPPTCNCKEKKKQNKQKRKA